MLYLAGVSFAVPGAMFLNDVSAANGQIYVTDTAGDAIYSYTPGGQPELLVQDVALRSQLASTSRNIVRRVGFASARNRASSSTADI